MVKTCVHCGVDFNINDPAKKRAGGKINECPDCSDEPETRYLGLQSADGKANGVTILKFESNEDRKAYMEMWRVNSGMLVGKQCQMMYHKTTPGVKFTKVHEQGLGMNHKGKS